MECTRYLSDTLRQCYYNMRLLKLIIYRDAIDFEDILALDIDTRLASLKVAVNRFVGQVENVNFMAGDRTVEAIWHLPLIFPK